MLTQTIECKFRWKSPDGEGTENIDICEEDSKKLCMSGDLFLKLAQIGVALERLYGSPRDIEWAVVKVICKGYAWGRREASIVCIQGAEPLSAQPLVKFAFRNRQP